ncbi:hypothetical protein CI109_102684 [Kwoniella shandongensis]|uniref:Uncharacterized protein n=1 Tax=Kwoniella shandongensis TaxID=1734106 RepID=A0A5M6BU89_9TREE|nr:uncharacterized protein CI109_007116 [Kwoniella shandongensis]KAA5524569.1 hypothetical protein CI109_007116 [Kwoniella shandongensis]
MPRNGAVPGPSILKHTASTGFTGFSNHPPPFSLFGNNNFQQTSGYATSQGPSFFPYGSNFNPNSNWGGGRGPWFGAQPPSSFHIPGTFPTTATPTNSWNSNHGGQSSGIPGIFPTSTSTSTFTTSGPTSSTGGQTNRSGGQGLWSLRLRDTTTGQVVGKSFGEMASEYLESHYKDQTAKCSEYKRRIIDAEKAYSESSKRTSKALESVMERFGDGPLGSNATKELLSSVRSWSKAAMKMRSRADHLHKTHEEYESIWVRKEALSMAQKALYKDELELATLEEVHEKFGPTYITGTADRSDFSRFVQNPDQFQRVNNNNAFSSTAPSSSFYPPSAMFNNGWGPQSSLFDSQPFTGSLFGSRPPNSNTWGQPSPFSNFGNQSGFGPTGWGASSAWTGQQQPQQQSNASGVPWYARGTRLW